MLPQARDRTFLNRADPRVRGRVTWFPLNGHGLNMGDVGGGFVLPPAQTFLSNGDPGPLAKGSSASVAASCTAASMGIAGGAARTFIFKIVNEDQSISYPLFGLGNASAGQDSTLYRSGYNNLTLDGWGGADFSFPAGPSYSSATLTGVITSDPLSGTMNYYGRFVRPDQSSGLLNASAVRTGISTPANAPLFYSWWPATGGGGNPVSTSRLFYLGILGGTLWSAAEAWDFVQFPDALWTPLAPLRPRSSLVTRLRFPVSPRPRHPHLLQPRRRQATSPSP